MKYKKTSVRIASLLLTAVMVCTMLPATVLAAEGEQDSGAASLGTSSMTECHAAHNTACGYRTAGDEIPCSHLKEDGTYSCAPVADEEYVCPHDHGCGYVQAEEGAPCTHSCKLCVVKDSGTPPTAPECICTVKCLPADPETETEAVINAECSVCSAEGADLSGCKGVAAVNAMAVGEVAATIGDTSYATLTEACAAVKNGETVTVQQTITQTTGLTNKLGLNDSYTLDLNGNTVSLTTTNANGIATSGAITITDSGKDGRGKLTINTTGNANGYYAGIFTPKVLTISGATLDVTTSNPNATGSRAIDAGGLAGGKIYILNGSDVTAQASGGDNTTEIYGIYATRDIAITDSTVTATAGDAVKRKENGAPSTSMGICPYLGDITIDNSTVTAKGGKAIESFGIETSLESNMKAYKVIVQGADSVVTATGGDVPAAELGRGTSYGIKASGGLTVEGGKVITRGGTAYDSVGIWADSTSLITGSDSRVEAYGGDTKNISETSSDECTSKGFYIGNSLTIENGATLLAHGGKGVESFGIRQNGPATVTVAGAGSKLDAAGGTADDGGGTDGNIGSYGCYVSTFNMDGGEAVLVGGDGAVSAGLGYLTSTNVDGYHNNIILKNGILRASTSKESTGGHGTATVTQPKDENGALLFPIEAADTSKNAWKRQSATYEVGTSAVGPQITVAAQSGALTYGAAGSATFALTGTRFGVGSYPAFVPKLQWVGENGGLTTAISGSGNEQTLTVTAPATVPAGKYNFKITSGEATADGTVTVGKGEYGTKTVSAYIDPSASPSTVNVALPPMDGASYGKVTITGNTDGLIDTSDAPSVSGSTLKLTTSTQTEGKAATLTIPVTGMANYKDFTMTVTVTVKQRETVVISGLTAVTGLIYNGTAQAGYTGNAVVAGSKVPVSELVCTYTSTDGKGYRSSTAPTNAGEYKLVVSVAASNAAYKGDHDSLVFTIGKKPLTIKPKDFSITAGTAMPAFVLTFEGIVGMETLRLNPDEKFECVQNGVAVDGKTAGTYSIRWTNSTANVIDGTGKANNYEITKTPTGTLTVTAATSGGDSGGSGSGGSGSGGSGSGGGGSSSSGGSSSGGGSPVITPPSTPNKPNPPATAESKVEAKVDTNGNATVSVPEKSVTDAIKAAQDAAKKAGTTDHGIAVTLNVETSTAANSISATLPQTAVAELVKAGTTELKIESKTADITLDLATMKQIQAAGGGSVTISANKVSSSGLSQAAQAAIGSRPVFNLSIKNGSKAVTSFGTGSVSVALPYTLGANEKAGNVRCVYVDDAGKVTYLIHSSYDANSKTLMFSTNHFSTFGIGYKADAPSFTDTTGHWAKADIDFAVSRGMLSGTSAATFSPDTGMTRGMFVTALGRLAGIDSTKYRNTKFTDVAATAYYAPYAAWAAEKGITSGTTATTFSPDKVITRQGLAALMANYAKAMGYTLPKTREAITFADATSIDSFAADAVKAMQMAGVMNGKNGNTFDPTGTATRAEVSAVLRRYVELVIDSATAQGLDTNDSGSAVMYEYGKLVKSASRTVNSIAYSFNANGEAALPSNKKSVLIR